MSSEILCKAEEAVVTVKDQVWFELPHMPGK
jgi:hypothetical protein